MSVKQGPGCFKIGVLGLLLLWIFFLAPGDVDGLLLRQPHHKRRADSTLHVSPHLQSIGGQVPGLERRGVPFSSYRCTGHSWSKNRSHQTCRFNNICFNQSSALFQYYVDPKTVQEGIPLFYDFAGAPHHTFPEDFVSTGHSSISPPIIPWAPKIIPTEIPSHLSGDAYADVPVAAYISLNDYAGNFGHVLFDFLYSAFNMMQLLQLYTPNFQLLLASHQGDVPQVITRFISPEDPEKALLSLISIHKALKPEEMTPRRSGLTCYQTLVAGSVDMQTAMARLRALPFRSAALHNLGINDSPLPTKPVITILAKEGRRRIENIKEIVDHLERAFPLVTINVLTSEQLEAMPLKLQIAAISSTSILITPCGGIGMTLVFLPPSATAIVMNYFVTTKQTSTQMDELYYWNIEYLDFQYFPVLLEDYEATSDRPNCEEPTTDEHYEERGALVHCNISIKDIARLSNVVSRALSRLQYEH